MKKLLMTASTWGHIKSFHLPYLLAFRQAGWTVHIGCANPPEEIEEADATHNLLFEKDMTAWGNFLVSRKIGKLVTQERYDLVICHTSLAAFFTRLAMVGRIKRPQVINMVHGYLFDDTTPAIKRGIYLGAEYVTAPVTDLIVTMNRWDYELAQRHRLGKRVTNVPGVGVPLPLFSNWRRDDLLREELGVGVDDTLLIYPAEFSKRKNQTMMIEAMVQLPSSVHLLLPGRGEYLEECKSLAERLGLGSRIYFPGFVTDLPRWYGISDGAVSVSRSEGLPFNVMEAMASGLPVVASAVKGHVDLITEGETGLLFEKDDTQQLVAQIMRLVEDESLSRHIAENGCKAMEAYGLDCVQPLVMEAYGQTEPAVAGVVE